MHQDGCCNLLVTWGVITVIVFQSDPVWTQTIDFGVDQVSTDHLSQ